MSYIYLIVVDGLAEMKCIAALKCLASFLIAKAKKRDEKQ